MSASKASVTKIAANRFLVEGVIAVIGGAVVNEAYSRLHATKAKAEYDAASLDGQNVEGLAYLAERQAARVANAQAYLVVRAARRDSDQASFGF